MDKPQEIIQLDAPNLEDINCPYCKSRNIKRISWHLRKIPDLGTKTTRKFIKFESVYLKCNSCSKTFYFERDGILKGLSATQDVLDTVLLLYYELENSGEKVRESMEKLYSVELKTEKIWYWVRKYGKKYCKKNRNVFKENLENCSGHLAIDGTFPKLNLNIDNNLSSEDKKKKVIVPWLRLTALPDGTLCAIWEEVKVR